MTREESQDEDPGSASPSRVRKALLWLVLGAALSGLTAGLLVVAEGAVRSREANRVTVPGNFPSAFYRHSRLQTALTRNQDYYGWFHVNRFGLRGPDIELERESDVLRVLAVGGSTTFETQVTGDAQTWPARLQHWLGEQAPDLRVEVLNAGVPGYTVFDHVIRLQLELFQFEPDVVLLLSGHNDISCAIMGRRTPQGSQPFRVPAESKTTRWLQSNSELYNKVKGRLAAMRFARSGRRRAARPAPSTEPAPRPQPREPQPLRCRPEQYRRDVTSFVALAKSMGFDVALVQALHQSGADAVTDPDSVTQAIWRNARPYVEPDSALRMHVRYRDILSEVAEAEGVHFIGTGAFGIEDQQYYGPGDPMHFNDEGADRMGREMAAALLRLGVLSDVIAPTSEPE